MYTLCSEVRNIVFDIVSVKKYYTSAEFNEFLDIISKQFQVYVLGYCPEFKVYNNNVVIDSNFSFENHSDMIHFLEEINVEQYNTIIITAVTETVKVATKYNLSTVGLIMNYEDYKDYDIRYMPDQMWVVNNMKDILLNKGFGIAYFEQIGLNLVGPSKFVYSPIYTDQLTYAFNPEIKADLIYTGRYFRFNDPRAYTHRLTQLLLHLKNNKIYAINALGNNMNRLLDNLKNNHANFDIITVVPSRPNVSNRLESVLNFNLKEEYFLKIKLNLLYAKENYETQKKKSTFEEKAHNVKDVFGYTETIEGHVLVIDDIFTSGATALECARMLYEAGASKVTILPFAVTQSSYAEKRFSLVKEENETYKLFFRTVDSQPFWSAGYQGGTKDYSIGRNEYLKGNNVDNYFNR